MPSLAIAFALQLARVRATLHQPVQRFTGASRLRFESWHGTKNGWTYHGCRCTHCWAANEAYKERQRELKPLRQRQFRKHLASHHPQGAA